VIIPGLRSLRGKFLLVVVGGVVLPLAILGLWLTRSAARSGEELLQTRLDAALAQVVSEAGTRWVGLRSEILDVADDPVVQNALTTKARNKSTNPRTLVVDAIRNTGKLGGSLAAPMILRDEPEESTWIISNAGEQPVPAASSKPGQPEGLVVIVPVYARSDGAVIGNLESHITLESLVPVGAGGAAAAGVILQVIDRSTGAALSPLPFDPGLLISDRFELAGETWLVRRRTLEEPALLIAAMSPLGAYTIPFESAARKGSLAILMVVVAALAFAVLLTGRLTHSLEELASATHSVASGDLDRRVSEESDDEVGRVGRAFNAMTESLHGTIRQLSQRQALAAVGEFAASLAHEIRNPLTSIRIDLQRVEEKLPSDSPLRVQLDRALREVQRLDQTVSGALRIARSGNIATDIIDLRSPLGRATEVAAPAFEKSGALLTRFETAGVPLPVRGDDAALEQVFLNVLLNAAQALGNHGKAGVSMFRENGSARIDIWDSGSGIPPHQLANVFDAFYSTKTDGTGLGLSVARQIVIAHGGTIEIDSAVDSGTTVSIAFPLVKETART
jgi:signal transduction histidine kinase